MKVFRFIFLLLLLNYFSTALNFLQTLNGLACFSQTYTKSEVTANNVVSLSVPYGSSNIDLQGFCNGGRIKHYDNNVPIGFTTTCAVGNRSFTCHSSAIGTKSKKELDYSCDCDAGSRSFDPVNMIITRETVFQTFNGSFSEHNAMCSARVVIGQCLLNHQFYLKFAVISAAFVIISLLLSIITNQNVREFEGYLLRLGQSTDFYNKYGFLNYCDWFSDGRSFCASGDGYSFSDSGPELDFIQSYSGAGGFFCITTLMRCSVIDMKVGGLERKVESDMGLSELTVLSNCLKLIIMGKKVHEGDHFLSIGEIFEQCRFGKKLAKTEFCGFLYGQPGLFDKLALHSRCFFGIFRQDAISQILKHNIKNPCPSEIKSSEWKMYLSDVNFHIGFRRSSKVKRFEASKGYIKYSAELNTIKPLTGAYLTEEESTRVEENILKKEKGVEEKKKARLEKAGVIKAVDTTKKIDTGDWVKNHDDLIPKIYRADSEEVCSNRKMFIVDGDEAVKRSDGCFKFKKSFLDALKEDAKERKDNLRGGSISVPYRHKHLEYKRICSHGLATKNFEHMIKMSRLTRVAAIKDELNYSAPMVKRVVYRNHKEQDVSTARRLKKSINSAIEISPNPFYLEDSTVELNHYLIDYSLGGENKSLFFLPSDGERVDNDVNLDILRKNLDAVEELVESNKLNGVKRERKHVGMGKKPKKKKKSKNKKGSRRDTRQLRHGEVFKYEDENPNFKIVKKNCAKRLDGLESLYDKSMSFCKKLNSFIFEAAKKGERMQSSNGMIYRGMKLKRWGLKNTVLSHIYKGCIGREPCFKEGICLNMNSALQGSLHLEKCYKNGYTIGDMVMGAKDVIEGFFKEIFGGKISLDKFMEIEI